MDLSKDPMALQRLKEAAEKAKLSFHLLQKLKLIYHMSQLQQAGPKHLVRTLTSSKFEQLADRRLIQTYY